MGAADDGTASVCQTGRPVELTQYLTIARRWWWLLLLTTLIGGGAAYGVSQLVTPTYRATTTMLVVQRQDPGNIGLADLQASERLANTFTELITVRPVLESAIERGGLNVTPEELEERLTVTSPPTTQLLEVSAEASTPEAARDLANIVAEAFIDSNESALASRPGIVSIVERAEAPTEPAAPVASLNALIGAFLALSVTAGIVAVVEYLDDTVKDADAVANQTGLPVVGHVTQFARAGKPAEQLRSGVHEQSPESEAYRSMRTNITYTLGAHGEVERLLVTSPGPGEGKSTTVANLAVVFGLAGQRVLVVDADLRRPSQHRIFGVPNTSGVTSLLMGPEMDLRHAIQRSAYDNVWVLTSGPIPANPSEVLGAPAMRELLSMLAREFDRLIIDSPPALAVTDPVVLSAGVSATLVVTQYGGTRNAELRHAIQRLAMAGRPIAGIVINRVRGKQASYYYYPEYRATKAASGSGGRRETREAREGRAPAPEPQHERNVS